MVHTNIVEPVPYEMEELEQIRYGLKLAKQAKEKALSEAKDGEDREMLEYDLENIQAAKERTEKVLSGCYFKASGAELKKIFPGFGK